MSIEKWINNYISDKEKKLREDTYDKLSKEEQKDLKNQKIRHLTAETQEKEKISPIAKDFLSEIIEFNNWLNNRTYIAGDVDKIEVWIKNLYNKLTSDYIDPNSEENNQKDLLTKYKEIPPTFLEEKIRIAVNKKLKGVNRSTSDNYYLKKLKILINEKLKDAEYYEILSQILES